MVVAFAFDIHRRRDRDDTQAILNLDEPVWVPCMSSGCRGI